MNKKSRNEIKDIAKEIKDISDMASLEALCNKYDIKILHNRSGSFYDDFKKEIVCEQPFECGMFAHLNCVHNEVTITIGIRFKEEQCNYFNFYDKNYPNYDDVKITIDFLEMNYGIDYIDREYGIISNNEEKNIIDKISKKYDRYCGFDTRYDCKFRYKVDKVYSVIEFE